MKLIVWNAAMRFRDKLEHLKSYQADILIIPESESPEKWGQTKLQDVNQFLWFGEKVNKGIGIFTLNEHYKIELHPLYNKDFRYIIPLLVTGKRNFILFAVWSQNTKAKFESYIGQIYLALKYYDTLLKEPCVIAGDWNSNKNFDHIRRVGTHTDVVNLLKSKGITSTYHHFYNEEHGDESQPTHYFRKEYARPFHIDYIFTSTHILPSLTKMEVGKHENWIKLSDHMPLFTDFKVSDSNR